MSQRIIFDDAINQIAAAERLSDAETSALRSELISDALCHALSVWPLGSRVKYDFNNVYSQTPSAKFGSHDWCTVKTSAVEVYFNDLDKWLELNWSQLEFRFAKANPSSASDADITLDPTLATFDKRERRTVYQVAKELAQQIRPDDTPVIRDSMRTQTHRGIEGEIISAILDGSLEAYEGDLPHTMKLIKIPDKQPARMSITLRLSRAILFLDEAINWLSATEYKRLKLASAATPIEPRASVAGQASDAQASASKHTSNGSPSRDTDLTTEILKAISKADDPNSDNSVWTAMRAMALEGDGLFTGLVDGDGLHYQKSSSNLVAVLSKDALSKRLKRIRAKSATKSR